MNSTNTKTLLECASTLPQQSSGNVFTKLFGLDDPQTTELILVRHAEADYQAIRNGEDPRDPPLSAKGRLQAMHLALRLRDVPIDVIYSSTMRRAHETAWAVAQVKDMPLTHVHELREIDIEMGAFRPTGSDPERRAAELARQFLIRPRWDSFPGCEPSMTFRRRVIQTIEAILAQHPGQRVMVVCHGGVINAYLSMVLDIPRDMFFLPEHTSLSIVRVLKGTYALQTINDFAHLLPAFNPANNLRW